MIKLAIWFFLILVAWAVYHRASQHMTPNTDALLLASIALISFGCVAVQIIWTWKWRALSLGLLSFFLATALLYTRVSSGTFGYDLWQQRAVLSLIRALYLVGLSLIGFGLVVHGWNNRDRAFPWFREADGRDPFGLPGENE